MSYPNSRDREIRYYQDRLAQLEQENQTLKSHHCFQHQEPTHYVDPLANSILGTFHCNSELNAQNERLEREAELYQKEIKR
jgi:cell division protein FtsB